MDTSISLPPAGGQRKTPLPPLTGPLVDKELGGQLSSQSKITACMFGAAALLEFLATVAYGILSAHVLQNVGLLMYDLGQCLLQILNP